MIYHVVSKANWQKLENEAEYVADSLASEGFIHCSTETQTAGVLERYYAHVPNLLLLHIEEQYLRSELKYEPAPNSGELFPHVFGPINRDSIVEVVEIDSRLLS